VVNKFPSWEGQGWAVGIILVSATLNDQRNITTSLHRKIER